MILDPESLRCFLEAARRLNFRAAARSVALSPSAFSERIRRLEGHLDAPLFERTTRAVKLTPTGHRLRPLAEEALAANARCLTAAHDDAPPPLDLTVGTRYELGMSWLLPSLDALAEAQPHRRLHLIFGDTPALVEALDRGDADAIVTSHRLSRGDLASALLHEERYVVVASPELISARPLATPEDAPHHTLLDISADLPLFRYFLDARPPSEIWGFAHLTRLGTIGAIRARALQGAGVAVLPEYFIADDLATGRLSPLCVETRPLSDWFRLIWRRGHPAAEALQALGDALEVIPLR